MNISKRIQFNIAAVGLLIFAPLILMAGTTGKIAGVVEDARTGEPIPGATIHVVGSDMATQTDIDGEYFIINLPAGTYTVSVSVIGFEGVQKENVRVLLDLTTPVDFEIEQVDIPLRRQVKVYAERPPIQKDLTASRSTYTADQISYIPNALSVQNIIGNMAGTVTDKESAIHIRGGRTGTISYFYDGFSIQDPFYGTSGMRIMPEALEEINLTSGGFTAEYGEALSGIVNAVTKEGSRNYHGKLRFFEGATYPYNIYDGDFMHLKRNDNRGVSYNFSGPVPLASDYKATFFLAGEWINDGGYLPHNEKEFWSQTGKLSMQPTPNLKLTFNGAYYHRDGEYYEHRCVNNRSYDFNQDGLLIFKDKSYLYGLKGSYQKSEKTIMNFSYSHFLTQRKFAPEHLFDTYWTEWPGYSEDSNGVYDGTIHEDNYRASLDYFLTGFTSGDDFDPRYQKRYTDYDAFSLNYTSQINKYNQIRIGGEYRTYDLFWDEKQFYNLEPYGEKYDYQPVYAMAYIQDKVELQDFIINAGLRWDYLSSEVDYWPDVMDTVSTPRTKSKAKAQISPRLGISHPISENTLIRFNYGYFFQIPRFTHMYTNLEANLNSGLPLVGNPDLQAEKTVAYELGLNHMLSEDVRLDITLYYKDIKDLISTREIGLYGNNPVTQFVNEDYGSVKGMDLTIEKIAQGNFSGSLVYSYMIAKGNLSDPREAYYDYIGNTTDSVIPVREFPLDFDQRHTATLNLSYRAPRDWYGSLFGIPVPGAWGLNVLGHYGSGLPYTITDDLGQRTGGLNEARLPSKYSVDMRFHKDIYMNKSDMYFSFFVEVENMFNKRNIIDVYTNTGLPDDDGRRYELTADPDGDGPYTAEDVNEYYRLMAMDPENYSPPRQFRVGVEFNF